MWEKAEDIPLFWHTGGADGQWLRSHGARRGVGIATRHYTKQLYYGQLPVPRISGFKDELSGLVITNAFEVGLLDPDTVERDWKAIADELEAGR